MRNLVNDSASGGEPRDPIAVFLLDDHEVVRRGVRDLLEAEADITVVVPPGRYRRGRGVSVGLLAAWR